MKLKTRIFTTLLAVLMTLSSFALIVGAESVKVAMKDGDDEVKYYLSSNSFKLPQDKLKSMKQMLVSKNGEYALYADERSGEIAVHQIGTDNILFSNPYDVGRYESTPSNDIKKQLMSQVIVKFRDNDADKELYSFTDAAMRGQISFSKIKNGIRAEYIIGNEAFSKLVPRWIPKESFDELILAPLNEALQNGHITSREYNIIYKGYALQDPDANPEIADQIYNTYPATKEIGAIYVIAKTHETAYNLAKIEDLIKMHCSDTYSFEQMDLDHETAGYNAKEEKNPVFKLALEYSLDDTGLSVRMPCNSLRYDTASYTLHSISILPYMGAGNVKNDGYIFYPDGSGTLYDFDRNQNVKISSQIYGTDYAYHEIANVKLQKAIRVPVYGTVSNGEYYTYIPKGKKNSETVSSVVKSYEDCVAESEDGNVERTSWSSGYVAVVESGDSLGSLEAYYDKAAHNYATVINYFNPKPKDSYDLADSISVANNSTWTVVSNRKYTGNIKIHYQMLDGEKYDVSWLGMAKAYRDYLIANEKLKPLTDEAVEEDIPLYMEVFGALETKQTIATMPVYVMTPMTTFEDVLTMYDELSGKGAKNVNFKLTGFANGGMYSTVPSSVKWEKAVGGKAGFVDLVEQAKDINDADDSRHLGLYPDFDFAYASRVTAFGALKMKTDAIKTIDNRYTSKRQYSATLQKYVSFFQMAISPSRYNKFYEKLMDNYSEYGLNSMSVGSLGTALNSDFDEEDPYNREDSKKFTEKALSTLSQSYSLMTDGGNAYSWGYVDHILNLDLDSSRFIKSSCSVPFLGAVLHGYVQFAGTALNTEGNTDYAMLKAIENGAGMYFVLSYQNENTSKLKEDVILSQNYSIRYDIWKEDVIAYYNQLNDALGDVQTSVIIDHKFMNYNDYMDLNGNGKADEGEYFLTERVLDLDELEHDILEEFKKAEQEVRDQYEQIESNRKAEVYKAKMVLEQYKTLIDKEFAALDELAGDKLMLAINKVAGDIIEDGSIGGATYKTDIQELWVAYSAVEQMYANACKVVEQLEDYVELIEKRAGTAADYQVVRAKECLAEAKKYLDLKRQHVNEKYESQIAFMQGDANNIDAIGTKTGVDFTDCGSDFVKAFTRIVDYVNGKFSHEDDKVDLDEIMKPVENTPETDENGNSNVQENELTMNRYSVTNNNVVSVTYGDIENGETVAKKTFILNYNNYAVSVTFNGVVYTVAAGGYIIVPTAIA